MSSVRDGSSSGTVRDVEGNRRMTSSVGIVLIVLLAVEGLTILQVRQLISIHVFLGVVLVGPVLLKMATTGYRFVRYYLGDEDYVRVGPPQPVLRVLGPLVILTSVLLLLSGVMLILVGPSRTGPWLLVHKADFVAWFVVMAVHVLGHTMGAVRDVGRELRPSRTGERGRLPRLAALTLALVLGVGAAAALYPSAAAWTSGTVIGHDDGR